MTTGPDMFSARTLPVVGGASASPRGPVPHSLCCPRVDSALVGETLPQLPLQGGLSLPRLFARTSLTVTSSS